ncbi:MAG TPA: hypothetical protein VJ440_07455 [Candidatus Brocadiaceae bacterium]|nr:hypothetical protein [Candidatus Brocadiaceae bacterium]
MKTLREELIVLTQLMLLPVRTFLENKRLAPSLGVSKFSYQLLKPLLIIFVRRQVVSPLWNIY